jgi:hypothetical protein
MRRGLSTCGSEAAARMTLTQWQTTALVTIGLVLLLYWAVRRR